MTADVELRPPAEDEWPLFVRAMMRQFGEREPDDFATFLRPHVDLDRMLAGFADDEIVATYGTLGFDVSLPFGAHMKAGGVTVVGVRTDHRRRGLLRRMMQAGFETSRANDEPLQTLYASEWPIYGRFGFGLAAPAADLTGSRVHLRLLREVSTSSVRLVGPEARPEFEAIYEGQRRIRPGMHSLEGWLGRQMEPPSWADSESAGPYFALLPDRGFVIYRIQEGWTDGVPDNLLKVILLVANDPEATAVLWQFLLSVDLVSRISARGRPLDDPLPHMLVDGARIRAGQSDPLYVRVLDVRAALEGRGYGADGAMTFRLHDESHPDNDGTWRLDVTDGEAACGRTSGEPDLEMDVSDLGACYLGGERFTRLVGARRVVEHMDGAAAAMDRLLAADLAPWNPRPF